LTKDAAGFAPEQPDAYLGDPELYRFTTERASAVSDCFPQLFRHTIHNNTTALSKAGGQEGAAEKGV
jgi:hypothetical protein